MKTTISLVLMAFLILSGVTKSDFASAAKPNENLLNSGSADRTISHRFSGYYWTPLYCDSVEFDILEGYLDVHCVMHYENGSIVWMVMRYTGSLTSQKTGEVFEIKEIDKSDLPQAGIITFHSNIKGDNGTHIITSGAINMETWGLTINKAICN